jgi:hypothetical protein
MNTHIKRQFVSIREQRRQIVSRRENGTFFAQQKVSDSTHSTALKPYSLKGV